MEEDLLCSCAAVTCPPVNSAGKKSEHLTKIPYTKKKVYTVKVKPFFTNVKNKTALLRLYYLD